MRSLALVAATVAFFAAAVLLLGLLAAPGGEPSAAGRAEALASELRCPDCEALSVAESRTAAAAAIRAEIERQVAAGRSDAEIRGHFVERYGSWILLVPDEPVLWWLPLGAVVIGAAAMGAWLWRGRGRDRSAQPLPGEIPSAERQRIADELEALDG